LTSWYKNFKAHTIKSKTIGPLPPEFIRYLLSDGVFLPNDGKSTTTTLSDEENEPTSSSSKDSDPQPQPQPQQQQQYSFPELTATIRAHTKQLGGYVLPKLNWSAPKDSTWINMSTLKCSSPNDIYTLLKSSDFIAHDLSFAFEDCTDKVSLKKTAMSEQSPHPQPK